MGRLEILEQREVRTYPGTLRTPHCSSAQAWPSLRARWAHKGEQEVVWMINFICQLGQAMMISIWSNTSLDVAVIIY